MARIEIKGEQHSVGEVFSERYAFIVPPYQRPYAWTTEHAGELLDDLLGSMGDADGSVDDLNPYFLGSIVLIKGIRPEAQIVDGQQRLITLTILLAALRSLVPAQYTESITRRLYEPADPLNNIPARYRVRPKDRDALFFQDFIQSEGGIQRLRDQLLPKLSDSQRNMRENALYFVRTLTAAPERQRIRLAQFVVQGCLLVIVSTPDLSSAYRIFSVLNDRGLDLSYADILKAEIIGQIPEGDQPDYTVRWENTEESLGREAFESLFGHIRLIYRQTWARGTVLDEFRKYVIATVGDSRRLVDDVLVPYGAAYYVVRNACYQQREGADKVNALLNWLNRIDNMDWVPPAMMYLSRAHDSADRLARFGADLERLAVSLMIRRQYANKRFERYRRVRGAIERGDDLFHPSSPLQLTPEECAATQSILEGDLYLMTPGSRNYALLRLDSALAGTMEATYGYRTVTVEHVLPQNPAPGSDWTRWFPTAQEQVEYCHRLGNLVLLSRTKNAQAANYDFERKKSVYFAPRNGVAPYALTAQVLREKEWTPTVVQRRQQELIGVLKQLWRL